MSSGRLSTVPWGAREALTVYGATWLGLPLLIVLSLAQLAPYYQVIGRYLERLDSGSIEANFILVTVIAIASMGFVWWYVRRAGAGLSELGFRRFNPLKAALLIVVTFIIFSAALYAVLELISWLVPAFDPDQAQVNEFTRPTTRQGLRLSLVALVILPAILEEVIFRGFMFTGFAKRLGWVGGALASSLLFGIAHLQPNIVVYTIVLGLLLCMLYRSTGSIWPGIVLHMINNYIAFTTIVPQ